MRKIYIVKTGSTFAEIAQELGDFEDWIARGLSATQLFPPLHIEVIHAQQSSTEAVTYPDPALCAGVVITGSHAMVTDDEAWLQQLRTWLQAVCAAQVPTLGICFGHQLLAQVLGGKVAEHPAGLELGTVPVSLQTDVSHDPLWAHMPECFDAQVVHYQSVRQLPPQAQVLAGNSHEGCQAFRWKQHVWGVQFHPEFEAIAMQRYIEHLQRTLASHGSALTAPTQLRATPEAASLLPRFAAYVHQHTYAKPLSATAATEVI